MNLNEHKKQLRNELKKRRSALSVIERTKMSHQIIDFLYKIDEFTQAKTIFCYISYSSEVDTNVIIDRSIDKNLKLAVPKVVGKNEMHAISLSNRDELEPDVMGILTPQSNKQASPPFDLAITPGLAFTEKGARLGYGHGYYDRWFANNNVKTKIGIAYEVQIVEELPIDVTDIPLDILVTEERIIDVRK